MKEKNFFFFFHFSHLFRNFDFVELTFRSEMKEKNSSFSFISLTYFVTLPQIQRLWH